MQSLTDAHAVPPRKALVDDGDRAALAIFSGAPDSAGEQRNAEGGEILCADAAGAGLLRTLRGCAAQIEAYLRSGERRIGVSADRNREDARNGSDALLYVIDEGGTPNPTM